MTIATSLVTLRPHRVGDIGWVIHRHGVIYAAQYGWDQTFEALVAHVGADFIDQFECARDCCWVAERDGAILGAAFVVKTEHPTVAKLRLVYVEPAAQGQGVGRLLVERCMTFARDAGYSRMALWTNDVLLPARSLYQKLGFTMTDAKPYRGFGHDLVGETWERDL
jgi:GNAT superfamily N-acetyltransferase